jgi:hypothetical protein
MWSKGEKSGKGTIIYSGKSFKKLLLKLQRSRIVFNFVSKCLIEYFRMNTSQ